MSYPSKSVGKFHFLLLFLNLLVSIALLFTKLNASLLEVHGALFVLANYSYLLWMIRVHVAVNRWSRDYPVSVGGFLLRMLPFVNLWGLASTFSHLQQYCARSHSAAGAPLASDAARRFKAYIPLLYIFYFSFLIFYELDIYNDIGLTVMTIGVVCSIVMYIVFLLISYLVNQCIYNAALQAALESSVIRLGGNESVSLEDAVSSAYGVNMRQAERWRRLVAKLIDTAAFVLIIMVAVVAGASIDGDESGALMLLLTIFALIGWLIYYALHLGLAGQTIGKWLMKIRIVKHHTGEPGGFVHNYFLRSFVNYLISIFVPVYSLADVCFIFSSDARCLHDRIAGTVVVDVIGKED